MLYSVAKLPKMPASVVSLHDEDPFAIKAGLDAHWAGTFFSIYSLVACNLLDYSGAQTFPLSNLKAVVIALLCPPPRPVPRVVDRTKEMTTERQKKR